MIKRIRKNQVYAIIGEDIPRYMQFFTLLNFNKKLDTCSCEWHTTDIDEKLRVEGLLFYTDFKLFENADHVWEWNQFKLVAVKNDAHKLQLLLQYTI